jgi:hypothetical protein
MTFRLIGVIAVLAIVTLPVLAQTPTPPNSGAGIAGQPGGKSGPAAKTTAGDDQRNPTTQDTSKIQGKPGGESGPAVNPPSKQ